MSSRKSSRLPSRTTDSKSSKIPPPSTSRETSTGKSTTSYSHSLFSRKKSAIPRQEKSSNVQLVTARDPVPPARTAQNSAPSTSHFGFRSRAGSASSSEHPAEKSQRNLLRRKPSSNNQRAAYSQQTSNISNPSIAPSPEPSSLRNDSPEEVPVMLGFSASPPPLSSSPAKMFPRPSEPTPPPDIYGLPLYVSPHQFPTPAPPFHPGLSSSPSTRYSESPSPWSRTSTPTSMSSHSPGVPLVAKFTPKPRQPSPTRSRPPVTRRRAGSTNQDESGGPVDLHGLPSLRESVTSSSSSGSTLRGGEKREIEHRRKKSRHRPISPPHSPPPRKSSQKFKKHKPKTTEAPPLDREPTIPILPEIKPQRPSREGTPKLDDRSESGLPVIQSNLPGIQHSSGHRRNFSSSSRGSFTLPESKGISLTSSRAASRNVSPSPTQSSRPNDIAPPSSLGRIPELKPGKAKSSKKGSSSPRSASPTRPATSKFGFFSRRTKASSDKSSTERSEKAPKKGPVAGTGHEGYGKYALRGRSGSQTSAGGSRTRSTSTGTTGSANQPVNTSRKGSINSGKGNEVDDFLRDRLDPVVIPGGGGTPAASLFGADMSRSPSNQSSQQGRPSFESKLNSSQVSINSKNSNELPRPTFGFFGSSRLSPSNASSRRPSTSSERDEPSQKPTLAFRRSLHRSQNFSGKAQLALPKPIETDVSYPSPSLGSRDTSIAPGTASSFSQTDMSEGKEGSWLRPKRSEKPGKSPRKWNFFQRTHNITPKETSTMTEVSVTISRHQAPKSVAHYALMDSGDQGSSENLEEYFREARDVPFTESPIDSPREVESPISFSRGPEKQSMLLPDLPIIPPGMQNARPASPKVMLRGNESGMINDPASSTEHLPTKPSRLPQVGRIPRVISTKERSKAANASGPRAFPLMKSGGSGVHSRQASVDTSNEAVAGTAHVAPGRPVPKRSNTGDSSTGPFDPRSFLSFPPRKGSEMSYSSSGGMSISATIAVNATSQVVTAEEEVWKEYDDLIDHMSPPTSTLGSPFQYDQPKWGIPSVKKLAPKESPIVGSDCERSPRANAQMMSPYRSSKFRSATNSGLPHTPLSLTEFLAGYGERNLSVRCSAVTQFSLSDVSRMSSASCYSQDESEEDEPIVAAAVNSKTDGSGTQVNLRFGALMTSKWLSFGRVLFSPAHAEILSQSPSTNRQDRILILDGLGNDDWSYYCALTYPDATVYNISSQPSTGSTAESRRESGAWQPPPNHRQIHHPDMSNPFPFPRGFFTAVVFRFPVLSTESTYRLVISECKRVLRPGGFLELSVLDLDMMNMGPATRRALMALKRNLQATDSNLSLKSTADSVQRFLGRRGFENLNRCNVGVPAAGSLASQSPTGSARGADSGQDSVSLTALLSNPSREGDEGITNLVAKVGRWWYSRCFESACSSGADQGPSSTSADSIWSDRNVLKECEMRKTSFKLLICYAQKPLVPRRRTVSL